MPALALIFGHYHCFSVRLIWKRQRPARAIGALLCRRQTDAPLRELAEWLRLSLSDDVPNLTCRLEARLKSSPGLCPTIRLES
jgi:hypothetical protein